jgi:iron-sulfur cluster repair protein YtfE (RIC family)
MQRRVLCLSRELEIQAAAFPASEKGTDAVGVDDRRNRMKRHISANRPSSTKPSEKLPVHCLCHHGKEEACLFPLLELKGVPPQGCPLGVLKKEHDAGRTLVAQFANVSGRYTKDGSEKELLRTTLLSLAELYGGHIWKEDYLLFPMTNKILSAEEQDRLTKQFNDIESSIGPDIQRRFEELADNLQRRAFHE